MPLDLLAPCLVKKDTVNGIIGNTQGVSKAIKPPKKPNTKMVHRPDFSFTAFSSPLTNNSLFFKSSIKAALISRLRWSTCCSATTISSPVREIWNISSFGMQTSLHIW